MHPALPLRILFHANGKERAFAKKFLDYADRIDCLRSLCKKCLFPGQGARHLFFAPRYAHITEPIENESSLPQKLMVVAMVRNEQIRMHDFMRHVCALFDRVLIIDHCSTDDTARIALSYQGVNHTKVLVLRGEDPGYYQKEYMTACANAIIKEACAEWIFFLDIDEFLPFANAREFKRALSAYREFPVIRMHWRNIALKKLDPATVQGAEGILAPTSCVTKIAIHASALGCMDISVVDGNHELKLTGFGFPHSVPIIHAFDLYHVPIYGKEALQRKIELTIRAFTEAKGKNTPAHLCEMKQGMESSVFNDAMLQGFAIDYGTPFFEVAYEKVKNGTILDGCEDIVINIAQTEKSHHLPEDYSTERFNLKNMNTVIGRAVKLALSGGVTDHPCRQYRKGSAAQNMRRGERINVRVPRDDFLEVVRVLNAAHTQP